MKLTEKSLEVLTYVRENGGRVSIDELAEVTTRGARSVGANVTDLQKKGLIVRDVVATDDEHKTTYVVLTEEGKAWTAPTDEE